MLCDKCVQVGVVDEAPVPRDIGLGLSVASTSKVTPLGPHLVAKESRT